MKIPRLATLRNLLYRLGLKGSLTSSENIEFKVDLASVSLMRYSCRF